MLTKIPAVFYGVRHILHGTRGIQVHHYSTEYKYTSIEVYTLLSTAVYCNYLRLCQLPLRLLSKLRALLLRPASLLIRVRYIAAPSTFPPKWRTARDEFTWRKLVGEENSTMNLNSFSLTCAGPTYKFSLPRASGKPVDFIKILHSSVCSEESYNMTQTLHNTRLNM